MSTFEEILAGDGVLVYRTKGISMEPMLRQNRDIVIVSAVKGRLKPMDVALYRRGKDHVLHRVISVGEHEYLIRGDNTYTLERVREDDVIGVLTGFRRKGKEYSVNDAGYRRYARFWCAVYPVRAVYARNIRRIKRAGRRILGKLGIKRR